MRFKDASCSLVIILVQRSHVRIMRGACKKEGRLLTDSPEQKPRGEEVH